MSVFLNDLGIVCSLGLTKQEVFTNLRNDNRQCLVLNGELPIEEPQYVGQVQIPENKKLQFIESRNNQLAYLAFLQIEKALSELINQYGNKRIAVVVGTSTAGIYEGELARKNLLDTGNYPDNYHYRVQEMSAPASYIASLCNAEGPVYSISTACSSSGKALASAKYLLEADLADVVIAGGVDSLTSLTINGFKSLESISKEYCAPFCEGRDGINIGEAAALFILSKKSGCIELLGTGETSDAHHLSAPEPNGEGAYKAMLQALDNANIKGEQIDYLNLHGTGTVKNDEMEAKAVFKACGDKVLCSSTKRLTGHTLGAAGALEIGFCWLLLSELNVDNYIPINSSDGEIDPTLKHINLSKGETAESLTYCMSNSFAFGGNNFSAILGKTDE